MRIRSIIVAAVVLAVLGAAWYLGSPLFINKEVSEDLPFSDITSQDYEDMKMAADGIGFKLPAMEEMKMMTQSEKDELEKMMVEKSAEMPDKQMSEPSRGQQVLARGMFMGADSFHQGKGDALIYNLADGSNILRFEDFEVTNGPDLRVLLATDAKLTGDYVELGKLKGNIGSQNYDIPANVDTSKYKYAVIYCKPFHVVFATADLE